MQTADLAPISDDDDDGDDCDGCDGSVGLLFDQLLMVQEGYCLLFPAQQPLKDALPPDWQYSALFCCVAPMPRCKRSSFTLIYITSFGWATQFNSKNKLMVQQLPIVISSMISSNWILFIQIFVHIPRDPLVNLFVSVSFAGLDTQRSHHSSYKTN